MSTFILRRLFPADLFDFSFCPVFADQSDRGTVKVLPAAFRCLHQRLEKPAYTHKAKRLDVLPPQKAWIFGMIPAGVPAKGDVYSTLVCIVFAMVISVEQHGRRQIRIYPCLGTERRQMSDIAIGIRSDRSEDLPYSETVTHQSKRKFEGIGVDCFANTEDRAGISRSEPLHCRFGLFCESPVIKPNTESCCKSVILRSYSVDLIKPCQLNGGNSQSLLQISRSRPRLRIQDQVKIGLCHLAELGIVRAG